MHLMSIRARLACGAFALVLGGCTSGVTHSTDALPRAKEIVQRQGAEQQELIRALAEAQRATANATWFLITNAAEQNLRSREGLSDDTPLSDQQHRVVAETARQNLGKLLGYVDAREEDLVRASESLTTARIAAIDAVAGGADASVHAAGSSTISSASDYLGSLALISELDELFDRQISMQIGYTGG